jgi:hypothetical protein
MAGGGDEAALMERTAAGVLRAPGLHGSTRGVPAEVLLGSRGSGNHRRRGIEVAEQITSGSPRVQFRRLLVRRSRVEASGSFLASRRSCDGVWPGLGCSGAAGPWWHKELCAAEQAGGGRPENPSSSRLHERRLISTARHRRRPHYAASPANPSPR